MQDRLCFEKKHKKEKYLKYATSGRAEIVPKRRMLLTYTCMNQVRWEEQHAKMEENDKAPSQINRLFIYY